MSLDYIDAHAHLNFDAFDFDRAEVIADMHEEGVGAINIGIDVATSAESIALAKENKHIWASVGCHPTEVRKDFSTQPFLDMIKEDKQSCATLGVAQRVVAVGECGLDYFRATNRDADNQRLQREAFAAQIELALIEDLPLILHLRPQEGSMDAYKEGLDILEYYSRDHGDKLRGTAHFFVGDEDIARRFLDLDFYISATGVVTISESIARVFAGIPIGRLLVETDAPFAAPLPHRGQRNEPAYVRHITAYLADLKGISSTKLAETLLSNTQRLFAL
ncbi:MAG: TatD family hydrolase [Candidatus Paceibacterota bacterium]